MKLKTKLKELKNQGCLRRTKIQEISEDKEVQFMKSMDWFFELGKISLILTLIDILQKSQKLNNFFVYQKLSYLAISSFKILLQEYNKNQDTIDNINYCFYQTESQYDLIHDKGYFYLNYNGFKIDLESKNAWQVFLMIFKANVLQNKLKIQMNRKKMLKIILQFLEMNNCYLLNQLDEKNINKKNLKKTIQIHEKILLDPIYQALKNWHISQIDELQQRIIGSLSTQGKNQSKLHHWDIDYSVYLNKYDDNNYFL